MNTVYLLTGGNKGDRITFLKKAREMIIRQVGIIIRESSVYETEPWGFDHKNQFLNQCLVVQTLLSPWDILRSLQEIEKCFKRQKKTGLYESRNLDIDILFYDDIILNEEDLKIPHPLLHERRFVLVPLVEIDPDLVHPVFHKTVSELLLECSDDKMVVLYQG